MSMIPLLIKFHQVKLPPILLTCLYKFHLINYYLSFVRSLQVGVQPNLDTSAETFEFESVQCASPGSK